MVAGVNLIMSVMLVRLMGITDEGIDILGYFLVEEEREFSKQDKMYPYKIRDDQECNASACKDPVHGQRSPI